MGLRLLQLVVVLAILAGSILYIEGYLGDIRDPSGERICRRAPDEIEAWSEHYTTRRQEDLARLAEWAREHPEDVNRQYRASCSTALHLAAEFGREDVAQVLLAHGADVDARAQWGDTPLHRAAWYGHPKLVELLLDHGGDVDARDDGGMTPLHEVMSTVRVENDLATRLAIARMLLDAGADPNASEGGSEFSPLTYAVGPQGHPQLVRLLLERGASPETTEAQGTTVLQRAASGGNLEAVRILVDHGADVNTVDRQSSSLASAAWSGDVELVRFLLERGADPNRTGTEHRLPWNGVPLEMALLPPGASAESAERRLEIASLLVAAGGDVHVRGREGKTLLHGAAEEGNLACARFLLDHGADVSARDSTGFTPLHEAVEQGNLALAELLLSRGAAPNAVAARGITPSALARMDPEMEALIRRHGGR